MGTQMLKLFNKYPTEEITVSDKTLAPFININANVILPHTSSRCQKNNKKYNIPLVERFACYLMRNGRNCGKKLLAMRMLESSFVLIQSSTGQSPLQIMADAVINAGPREDSARIGRGGAMKRTSVDVSSRRRLNIALILIQRELGLLRRKTSNL